MRHFVARQIATALQDDVLEADDQTSALKQILAVFFMAGSDTAGLCSALLPALRICLAAPPGSLDAGVNLENMINFVIAMSKPTAEGDSSGNSFTLHEQLAQVRQLST